MARTKDRWKYHWQPFIANALGCHAAETTLGHAQTVSDDPRATPYALGSSAGENPPTGAARSAGEARPTGPGAENAARKVILPHSCEPPSAFRIT